MDFKERYLTRLNNTVSNLDKSKYGLSMKFETSPSYKLVKVNGIDTDSIVYTDSQYDEQTIIFKPDSIVDIGSVVEFNEKQYLLISFFESDLTPKGELKLCNSALPIQSGKTRVLIGHHPRTGEPIYDWVEGEEKLVPCVTETKYSIREDNDKIPIPDGTMLVTMQYQESLPIQHNFEFSMYDERYKVLNVDKTKVLNGKGIIVITAERVQISEP
ncbi:hypothetical protein [Bacillus infantis]|uniref:hypothetical protein n=1 Tax=Bacillus infantis TaxID=324767 RepID=UPI00209F354B|nr:hypothetical protein [Bacillus infantis]MCP1159441.1 hypothetical protein [Bacillus infantis]